MIMRLDHRRPNALSTPTMAPASADATGTPTLGIEWAWTRQPAPSPRTVIQGFSTAQDYRSQADGAP